MERFINLSPHISLRDAHPAQPRAIGAAALSVRGDGSGQTRLADLRQVGSTKLVFPRNTDARLEAIIVNTAGGITGGDDFTFDFTAGTGAALTLTTQAAERAYRAQPQETGRVKTKITVQADARLDWLPQELILFEHCALDRRLDIDLTGNAQLLMVEPVVFGRAAMQESLRNIRFDDRIRISRDGRPIYLDGMQLRGDATAHLARAAIAGGAGAMASLVLVRPDAAARLTAIRATLPPTAGASLIAKDVLVLRHLAADSFALRRDLIPILDDLTDHNLPISWRL